MKLHHNKKRNVGLVYELLTREITSSVISGNKKNAQKALSIIANHLSESSELYEELSLHKQVISSRGSSKALARRIVDELKAAGIRLSGNKSRERLKTDLIHEMNKSFGIDIFDKYRIPDYVAHASVNVLLSRGFDGRIDEGVELAKIEEHLIEYISTIGDTKLAYNPDSSVLAYKKAVSLFEQEFSKELTKPQCDIIKEYVKVTLGGNVEPFLKTFEKQKKTLSESFRKHKFDEAFVSDTDMSKKLDEAIKSLSDLKAEIKDEAVESLILYHNLESEILS